MIVVGFALALFAYPISLLYMNRMKRRMGEDKFDQYPKTMLVMKWVFCAVWVGVGLFIAIGNMLK